MVKGLNMLKDGRGDLFISAGSTGALMAGGLFILGRIQGLDRPALASVYPIIGQHKAALLIDAGANAECKADNLLEFGIMMTRGIVEIARLGVALGGEASTFWGLTGMGDLIVTCTSMHSRNRRCGMLIGQGMAPADAVAQVGMVVEGMYTAEAAYELAKKVGVEMPFTDRIYKVIRGEMDARTAAVELMTRERKHEPPGGRRPAGQHL